MADKDKEEAISNVEADVGVDGTSVEPGQIDPEASSSATAQTVPLEETEETEATKAGSKKPKRDNPGQSNGVNLHKRIGSRKRGNITKDQREWQQASSPFVDQSTIGNFFSRADNVHIHQYTHFQSGQLIYDSTVNTGQVSFSGVESEEIQFLASVYQRPRLYDRAYNCLIKHHWVILRGRPQTGKRATALYMAYDLRGETPDLHKLSAEINLKEWITGENLKDNRIYFIEGFSRLRTREIHAFDWELLGKSLKGKNCYLIISAREDVHFSGDDMPGDMVYTWLPPDNARLLVEKHLRYFEVAETTIQQLVNEPDVINLLNTHLPPGRARMLAERLNLYAIGEYLTLEQAVQGFTVYDDETISSRLGTALDDEERAFRIALSVFSGLRYRMVEEAAEQLATLLISPDERRKIAESTSNVSLFDLHVDDKLERAQARLITDYPIDGGWVQVELVHLEDPSFQPAMLSFVWRKVTKIRPLLLSWLREFGHSPYREVRMRVAAAVAFLAELEFETVLYQVLIPWAIETDRAKRRLCRATLSYTFASLVRTERLTDPALDVLRHWSQSNDERLVWAAVRAYGVVGQFYPREAMERWLDILIRLEFVERTIGQHILESLHIIVDEPLRPLFDSLSNAISTFFLLPLTLPKEDFVRIYKQIVASLRTWVGIENRLFSILIAIPLFLALMDIPIIEEEDGDEESADEENGDEESVDKEIEQPVNASTTTSVPPADKDKTVEMAEPEKLKYAPVLLVLANHCERDDPFIQDLAWLLSEAIRTTETRSETIYSGLYGWLAYVEEDRQLYQALKKVLRALVKEESFNHPRWHREIGRPFENWARYSKHPLTVAGHLVEKLGIQRQR